MSRLKLIRGRDIEARVNNCMLFGLTELDVTDKPRLRYVHEYLTDEPCGVLRQGHSYQIRLKLLTLFSDQIPTDTPFELSVSDGEYRYIYEQCRVAERTTAAQGNESAREVFRIEAQRMREQEIDNE